MTSKLTREKAQWFHDACEEAAAAGIKLTMNPNELLMFTSYALAAMDSEPVAYIFKHPAGRLFWALTDESNKGQSDVMPVYAEPQPAPVVPEDVRQALSQMDDEIIAELDAEESACRAATLQAGNSPANPDALPDGVNIYHGPKEKTILVLKQDVAVNRDCWCRTCRPVVLNDMRFVVCPDCGNKRCPRASDHRNACTGSNEPGQEGSAYPADPQEVPDGK
ncbi:hypothetical protein [Klebsiella quasipneumoniae]|uniref:hypothetical protein n=1 Tax=Klebsiella quasipneumoniae TaxID=1463165 RepID=UPI000E00462C|nr:hypothetical protein [Klebsiella quasipneumoniae]BBR05501.1 hypothetical protein WP3S18C02_27710 [Klebsiella quasipneumoniae]STR06981.1 Uncharacterised protein [Klebsiella quasipneumoniae]